MKMGTKAAHHHMTDLLFTLALFCVFAASALMVVLIGANVYKSTVRQMDDGFTERTSLTYVATKLRQNDTAGAVHLEELAGGSALVLDQTVDGVTYQTWIYHYDGALRESFVEAGSPVEPEFGWHILDVAGFGVEESEGMLLLRSVDEEGNATSQWVFPRCGLS